MRFRPRFLSIAVAGLAGLTPDGEPRAQDAFYGNIVFDNGLGSCDAIETCAGISACSYLALPGNDQLNPGLANPFDTTAPSWVPLSGSPALGTNDEVWRLAWPTADLAGCSNAADCPNACEDAITEVCFRGAIPSSSTGADWTQAWTYYLLDGLDETGNPRADIDYTKPLVVLEGELDTAAELTLTPAQNYLLRGRVFVGPGRTLSIQAGTVIFGERDTSGYLVVQRGAEILAFGSVVDPIVFTSDQIPGSMKPGDWGGIVVNGDALSNCANCGGGQTCTSEGPPGAGSYCGPDDCDGSGVLKYVRVEYAGVDVMPDNELNAFTFNGVGCGTTAEFLQAHLAADDAFAWFGGKMRGRFFVATGAGDDGFDWQLGNRGALQFGIVQHYPDRGDRGVEGDNNEILPDAGCRSQPLLANLTLVGGGSSAAIGGNGIHLRHGTDAYVFNSIVLGWPGYGLAIEHRETCDRGFAPDPGAFCGPALDAEPVPEPPAAVFRAFPNPVLDRASFAFSLDVPGRVQIAVFDTEGRRVAAVVDREMGTGGHRVDWRVPSDLARGVYHVRFESPGSIAHRKLHRIR